MQRSIMGRAANFACELVHTLKTKKTNYSWEIAKPPGDNRECVDVIGKGCKSKRLILVEVERRWYGPVANIAKIWKWLDKDAEPFVGRKIIVIQAFSSFYHGQGRPFLKENSEFLGRQLEKQFKGRVRYIAMSFKFSPRKKRANVSVTQGGGAMRNAARKLANQIALTVNHVEHRN
jgi:hypothetical protein